MTHASSLTRLLLLLLCSALSIHAVRILMNSPQIISHVLEQVAVGEELASRGHEVYAAIESNFPQPQIDAMQKKGIKILTYKVPANEYRFAGVEFETDLARQIFKNEVSIFSTIGILEKTMLRDCECMMNDAEFLKRIKDLKFSLALVEPFLFGYCSLILPAYLDIPFVTLTNMYDWMAIRAPALPSFYPRFFLSIDDTPQIAFKTRFAQFLIQVSMALNFPISLHTNTSLLERFAPSYSNWKDLLRQSSLFFYEVDNHLASPLPSLTNHISLAGITCKPARQLQPDFDQLMTSNEDGVILMTFGSLGNLFPEKVIDEFFAAFARLKQTVIAKFKVDASRKIPPNVKVLNWLPQNDILGHPNLRLFITHCGNNGQHEALYHGKPMLGFPLYAEQKENCQRTKMKGFSLCMDINDFTAQQLVENINILLNDNSYKEKIQRSSQVFRDQPMTPQQRAIFWIEHVIKYGSAHLRSTAMDLSLCQFLSLDVIAALVAMAIATVVVFAFSVRCLSKCLCGKRSSKLKLN